jgi:hypothetical protein
MSDRENFWKLPRSFAWGLPLVAAWSAGFVYAVFHLILGVPREKLASPVLAFSGITTAFVILIPWAIRYRISHHGDRKYMIAVISGYFLVFDLLVGVYTVKLRVLLPRDAVAIVIIAILLFCVSMLISLFRKLHRLGL